VADESSTLEVERRVEDARPSDENIEHRRLKASVLDGLFGSAEPASVGRFRILDHAGEGGFGVVYAAYDPQLDRKVALKMVRPTAGGGRSSSDSDGAARLLREAKAMAQLRHPNLVAVHDAGQIGSDVYIAMEYVDGQTLTQWLGADASRPPAEILRVLVAAGRGLAAAHAEGLVHRDFKPANVLVDANGEPRVTDFGLARRTGGAPKPIDPSLDEPVPSGEETVTQAGAVIGTPAYMAPEQHTGNEASPSQDQFSFCVAAYEALYRQRPFQGTSGRELHRAKVRGEIQPPPVAKSGVSPRVRRAILRGLSGDPADRWPNMNALLAELEPGTGRRSVVAAVGIVGIAAAIALGRGADETAECTDLPADLGDLWGQARKTEVADAFERASVGLAEETLPRVVERTDLWAERWSSARAVACDPSGGLAPSHRVVRQRCLRRARMRFESLLDVMADADLSVVARSVAAVGKLPNPDACGTPETLEATPTPADAALAADVAEVRDALAAIESQMQLGRPASALEAIDSLEPLAYDPLTAELTATRAQCLVDVGRYEEGAEQLRAAQLLAVQSGHDHLAVHAATALTFVLSTQLGRGDASLVWHGHAEAMATRAEAPPLVRATIDSNYAAALSAMGRRKEAAAAQEHAVALQRSLEDDRPEALANKLHNLGVYRFELGETGEAETHLRAALELRRNSLGRNHPRAAKTLQMLANVALRRGDQDRALQLYDDALTVFETSVGSSHPDYGKTLANRGVLKRRAGDLAGARADLSRAAEVMVDTYGEASRHTVRIRNGLALVEMDDGNVQGAHAMLKHAVDVASGTVDDVHLSSLYLNLGLTSHRLGRLAMARVHYARGLALAEQASKPRQIADAEIGLAELDLAEGLHDAAAKRAEHAATLLAELQGSVNSRVEATVLWARALQDPTASKAKADEARALAQGHPLPPKLRAALDAL